MADRRRTAWSATVALAVTLAVTGCGVSTSGSVDLGDGLVAGAQGDAGNGPPGPDLFSAPDELVSAFLNVAVESGQRQPLDRVEEFLTDKAQQALQPKVTPNPPNPVIIRLLGDPVKAEYTQQRRAVDVTYQVIGSLNDKGRVDDLADSRVRTMRFWVSPNDNNVKTNRIDEIENAPGAIMFTDQALNNYYQVQPVYFWDALSKELVPDLRYLPKGLGPDLRAGRIVQWLVDGPSGWLIGAAQRLPAAAAVKAPVTIRPDGTIVVNLTAQAGLGGDAAIQRLYRQLQWSLQSSSGPAKIELDIEGKAVDAKVIGGLGDYAQFNQTSALSLHGQKYDIVGGKVVSFPATAAQPPVLAAKENAAVTYAAMSRNASVVVLVRTTPDSKRLLQVARDGVPTRTVSQLPTTKNAEIGRPVWINGDHLLLTCAGKLWAFSTNSGDAVNVTPSRFNRVDSISVSPDGQRIAFVGDGQPYVASLSLSDDGTVTVGTTTRWLLGGQMSATAVAWISQTLLYVAGTSTAGTPVLYRVTADGVIAVNESKSLAGVKPSDVVAYPTGPFNDSSAEMYLLATPATYLFRSQQLTADPNLKAPFFGY